MSGSDLVSVIIPCYKQAMYLGKAIESVLQQTYQNVEIIVVDDGSPDNTSEVAALYPQVKCIRQSNQGLAGARNSGFHESKGDYLVFLDADDLLLPDALEVGLNSLKSYPDCAFVTGHCRLIDADGSPLPSVWKWSCANQDCYQTLLSGGNYLLMPGNIIYQRWALDAIGLFDPAVNEVADYDMYLRITKKYTVYCHHRIISEYRQHATSMTRNHEAMLKASLAVLRPHWSQNPKNKVYQEAYRSGVHYHKEIYGDRLIQRLRYLLRSEADLRLIRRDVFALLRYCPSVFFRHVGRKLYCLISGIKSDHNLTTQA